MPKKKREGLRIRRCSFFDHAAEKERTRYAVFVPESRASRTSRHVGCIGFTLLAIVSFIGKVPSLSILFAGIAAFCFIPGDKEKEFKTMNGAKSFKRYVEKGGKI